MAISLLRGIAPQWYTPDSEKDEEAPSRFKLKPLTAPQLEGVMEFGESGLHVPIKNYGRIVSHGLVEWENVPDPETGKAARLTPSAIARLPSSTRIELAAEILQMSQVSGDDEKN